MKIRSELTSNGYKVLRIHETPTQREPVVIKPPRGQKHPAGLTCGKCGAMYNTTDALCAHDEAIHKVIPLQGNRSLR